MVAVPTIDGEPHELRIPAGTQTGETFIVKGKGVPRLRGNGRGDMIVHAHVMTPGDLSKEQKELLKKLADSMGVDVRPQEDRGLMGKIRNKLELDAYFVATNAAYSGCSSSSSRTSVEPGARRHLLDLRRVKKPTAWPPFAIACGIS